MTAAKDVGKIRFVVTLTHHRESYGSPHRFSNGSWDMVSMTILFTFSDFSPTSFAVFFIGIPVFGWRVQFSEVVVHTPECISPDIHRRYTYSYTRLRGHGFYTPCLSATFGFLSSTPLHAGASGLSWIRGEGFYYRSKRRGV